jgi:hypothetical protein
MKNFILIITILFGMTVTACYSDNYKVVSFDNDDGIHLNIVFMFKGNEHKTSINTDYLLNEFSVSQFALDNNLGFNLECYNELLAGTKMPDCMIPTITHLAMLQ